MRAGLAGSGLLLLLGLSACGGGGGGEAVSTAPTTTEAAPATGTTSVTTTTAEESPCEAASMASVVQRTVGEAVATVEVVRCRNGYARVSAAPDASLCPPECYETADVLLRWDGDRWMVVDYGTSIGCDEEPLPPAPQANREACAALGYPQPSILTGASFQLPSRNIGCRAGGGALRCDILSGLRPEPGGACELDWVGITLPAAGRARPQCAGDTAYDASAPVLAYGDVWNRGGFWCRSSESGLLCVNRDLQGSFELARERWSAG